ncbi:4-amino-4-deoxy-L-arabinose transferase-like glycosyltransferase [Arcticibacter pallidicorallinus]|uniref:4-amino-4-deoxy-L-arabinose transferase-like glycosyltransferase n=1 Tax=Arcticibacter pallidicorallinus TaxID=1259464 RepID=A0A2T0TW24_9SPHI|nr:hypothetical protein [Arcticibacter pallidicorallinus]PRY49840.1 4-amino-4-deoxy-L-arabinose transferase-like glycosyltransferase [Arcticibacter pallidicorallinus]
MKQIEDYIDQYPGRTFLFLIALSIPAFLFNLGLLPLFADESTRSNVALEMIVSGNYSVPTIAGEYYYNKPPLYNWILAGLYLLTGSYSEFITRLPAAVPMFLYALTIYIAVRTFLTDKRIALMSAFFFLVNGRMLLYDSMLGHIDIFYSWLTFISFMSIFYFYQKKQWFFLFLISYLITSVTFLSKGLPSVVFQGFTLIAFLAVTKNFKKLFSWQHIISGSICLLIIGLYFYNYSLYNPDLGGYFSTIWDQSSQRTAVRTGLWSSIQHLVTFPFEHVAHMLPTSLLVIFCFHKKFLKELRHNEFLFFCAITFLANIWVYWLSPETRPRYLLMLYPLLFIIWSHAYYSYREEFPRLSRIFNTILLVLGFLVSLAMLAPLFLDLEQYVDFLVLKVGIVFLGAAFFTWLIYKFQRHKLVAFLGVLIAVRLAFSFFVLPHRAAHNESGYFKAASIEMARISKGESIYFYHFNPPVLEIPFYHRLIFYIERERMEIMQTTKDDTKPGYYLTFDRDLSNPQAVLVKSYNNNLKLFKVK